MDRALYIERNRAPLLVEVLKLFAMIGLTEGVTIERISRPLHRQVLGILRKAESAVRRLIVTAARDIVLEPTEPRQSSPRPRDASKDKPTSDGEPKQKRKRGFLFGLFDPPRRSKKLFRRPKRRPEPRISVVDLGNNPMFPIYIVTRQLEPPPAAVKKADDGTVSAKNLIRRLIAAADALQDIPRHAMRLARWQARPKEERRPERWSPLRTGRPPGFRQKAKHVVDDILKECHWLAQLGNPPLDDTS
jgi:hypothetical protein